MDQKDPVIIAGGGPGGLSVAVSLAQQGIPVTVLERDPVLAHDLRAGSFHPPTIEIFDRLGVGEAMRAAGIKVSKWQMRDRREGVIAEFDLGVLSDVTPHPYRLHCEQHKLTPILAKRLASLPGTELRFSTALVTARDKGDHVEVVADGPDGREILHTPYLIGADGARSMVRKELGVEFEGFTWPERYLVASTPYDLAPHGFALNAYIADPVEWCAIFKMPHHGPPGLWRLAFPIAPEVSDDAALDPVFVRERLGGFLPELADTDIPYCGIYAVHQRVAKTFRIGRIMLLGDAAHINNPLGGMGLNSSVQDAANLGEKLGAILTGDANDPDNADAPLDRYVRQRRTVTVEFVQAMSIRNKRLLEERDPATRREHLDELRGIAADPAKAHAHLMRTSMIESMHRAATIE